MDPRTNGHGDDDRSDPEPNPPRFRGQDRRLRSSRAESLRAADQLARLQARIRDFHRNLDSLDAAEADVTSLSRTTAEAHTAADNLVSRAAAAARLAVAGEPVRDDAPAAATSEGAELRRRRSDGRPDEPSAAQRRIDALRPGTRKPAHAPSASRDRLLQPQRPDLAVEASARADRIGQDAEKRAEQLLRDAARDAAAVRDEAERDMQLLWEALEAEVETIQTEISRRVDQLAGRMESVSWESEQIHGAATEAAEQIRAEALAAAERIRQEATGDAEALLAVAEREAHALLAEARSQADALIAEGRTDAEAQIPEVESAAARERGAAERLAEQIREATAALTRRVSRAGEDLASTAREVRGPASVPGSIREVLDGLGAAVSLIERSLAGLAELLGDSLGSAGPDER